MKKNSALKWVFGIIVGLFALLGLLSLIQAIRFTIVKPNPINVVAGKSVNDDASNFTRALVFVNPDGTVLNQNGQIVVDLYQDGRLIAAQIENGKVIPTQDLPGEDTNVNWLPIFYFGKIWAKGGSLSIY